MTFLNATLLLGCLAGAVPIVLHLLARQQPKRVVLPTVQFLTQQLTNQQSRLRIRRWWLLAMRIAAVVAMALALARPAIASSSAGSWLTLGLIGLIGVGLLVAASIAWTRQMARGLGVTLLIGGVLCLIGFLIGGIRTWAGGEPIDVSENQPMAIAVIVDNGPTSGFEIPPSLQLATPRSQDGAALVRDSWQGTRLGELQKMAREVLDRVNQSSRAALIDRSAVPPGFSIDMSAARRRLMSLNLVMDPLPLLDRVKSATELLATSDLPDRQIVIVTDRSEPTWQAMLDSAPNKIGGSRPEQMPVKLSVLCLSDRFNDFEVRPNRSLGVPRIDRTSMAAGVPIPVSIQASSEAESDDLKSVSASLSVFERAPSLPVYRDDELVTPPMRQVDRVSVEMIPGAVNELVLTLPPLPTGTFHAVVELAGEDRFTWDDRRYLSIELPEPTRLLLVGSQAEEMNIMASVLTAPYTIDDPAAAYRIDRIGFEDMRVVDLNDYRVVVLLDPPMAVATSQDGESSMLVDAARTDTGLASIDGSVAEKLHGVLQRDAGVLICLGPSTQVFPSKQATRASEPSFRLLPPIARSWRVPAPGTFLQVTGDQHPATSWTRWPSIDVAWADYRVERYWQVKNLGSNWRSLAHYVSSQPGVSSQPNDMNVEHSAVIASSADRQRLILTTTPLPGLGPETRDWNSFFSAGDAWPAFMLTRSMVAFLAGRDSSNVNVQVGQIVTLPVDADDDPEGSSRFQFYPPPGLPGRTIEAAELNEALPLGRVTTPGTYFVRGQSSKSLGKTLGFSANLPERWSNGKLFPLNEIQDWSRGPEIQVTDQSDELVLGGAAASRATVSLFPPMMLLAAFAFIAEQLLSNRFYQSSLRSSSSPTQPVKAA